MKRRFISLVSRGTRQIGSLRRGRFLVAIAAVLGMYVPAHAASAHGSYPTHRYSVATCQPSGWITVTPEQLETEPGVGMTAIPNHQFIYFRVWRYSYRLGEWRPGAYKRLYNGQPGTAEVFDRSRGYWVMPNGMLYADSFSLNPAFDFYLGTQQVGVPGDWGFNLVAVETYWEPATTGWNMTNPSPLPGGTLHIELNALCIFR
jgi:hypothetical protein